MVFKKLMKAMGVGGPQVETILHSSTTQPGGTISGEVNLIGGEHDSDIKHLSIALRTRVEVESGDNETLQDMEYAKVFLAREFELDDGARHSLPFTLQIPWETPLTHMYGQPLRGTTVGVATELEVARAVDATDLDPIVVNPLPAQERILEAFANIGFRFRSADCERGKIWGVRQQLPFYQEIEFFPPPQYVNGIKELEVTFVANASSMEVVLELSKRAGVFTEGQDSFARFTVDYASIGATNWEQQIENYLNQAGRKKGFF
ncbi:sporulation protein [Thermomonospora umbrina]|uniref:Sporulation-control protein n=1 Tax=Thermomonospora umbrina TaxID=111806 RepID=A0A3D9SM51_9ACTN|nr:sporulation protein [Thermomonospora umbrina]REE96999.1 sporulation-control protein [Thermomonospora umbrina]